VRAGPLAGDQAAVPPQDGAGGDQPVHPQPCRKSRISAARTARSAQSSRGRGLVRRSTVTSCRSTSSSASLDADDRASRIRFWIRLSPPSFGTAHRQLSGCVNIL
jgi:hypothetical protein